MTEFYKYHGAGNDFILIDDRNENFDIKDSEKIRLFCHRRFGIGADGIILIRKNLKCNFEMIYINSDGSYGAMCGNGGRCAAHFAYHILKITKDPKNINFTAVDGIHKAEVLKDGEIKLKMQDINKIAERNSLPFVLCGTTPHNIAFVENLRNFPVVVEGRRIRYSDPEGVNVNFVEISGNTVNVRTYERGVEDETFACGTGATSVAVICHNLDKIKSNICHIKMPGGNLTVEFQKKESGSYENIWLTGPAVCVFKGEIK